MYQIRVFFNDEFCGYLLHKDRTKWSLRTAKRHAKEMTIKGYQCFIEEV